MRKISAVLAVVVILTGAIFAITVAFRTTGEDVRINYDYSHTDENTGKDVVDAHSVRIQKSNGDWEEVMTYVSPTTGEATWTATTIGLNGKGAFAISTRTQQLHYLGERPAGYNPQFDSARTRLTPGFVEDIEILGEPVIVTKDGLGELARAVNLNGAMLRLQMSSGHTIQATKIERGKFELDPLPDWPVNYDSYQKSQQVRADLDAKKAEKPH